MRLEEREDVKYVSGMKRAELIAQIDSSGGWPVWATHLVFRHGFSPFDCAFADEPLHDEWWSICLRADEYYWAKVSDTGKAKVREDFRYEFASEIRRMV